MDPFSLLQMEFRKSKHVKPKFDSHANYEIFYFHEGRGNYLIGGNIYVLVPGDLIIMHGMTLHSPKINENFNYVRSIITFDPSYIRVVAELLFSLNLLEPFEELGNYRINLGR